jgi:predicted dehydrogenase
VRLSRIYGREGTVRFESNGVFVLVQGRRSALRLPGLRDIAGYRAMFNDFFDAIRTGREPQMTLDRAENDIRLVNRIYASMEGR